MTFEPNGLITLTSDFGLQDPFVGCMKGVIAGLSPDTRIIDLCHDIPPQDLEAAGFWLSRSFGYFPAGTLHLAVVDPGVGGDRGILLVTLADQCFLAPDNGLLGPLLTLPEARARLVAQEVESRHALPDRSTSFHGRDVFAPLAAALASGELIAGACGEVCDTPVPGGPPPLIMSAGQVQGQVVVVDRFGNLITNIDASMIGPADGLEAWVGEHRLDFHRTYCEAAAGEIFALVNGFQVVEIASRNDSAARMLGIGRNDIVQVSRPRG